MQTVGEILRLEREKKGLSIKDIELGTSIRTLYIKAIEDNDFKVIPGEVYLKGFIRNYASFLGLDAQGIMDVYRQNQNPEAAVPPEKPVEREKKPQEETKDSGRSERSESKKTGYGWIAAVLLIAIAAGGAYWWLSSGQTPSPAKETKPAPAAPLPSQPEKAAPAPAAQNKPVMVTAKFTANCWILVMADGKEVYQGTVKAGETITWEAEKNIVLKAGNAGALDLTYNGQPAGKLGENGEVVEKTFTAK
jgi:cytoskeletal protein RodZ